MLIVEKKMLLFAWSMTVFVFLPFSVDAALEYDAYRDNCVDAEKLVLEEVKSIISKHQNAPAQLLRLLFHDCFIAGCDASVMLDDSNGMANHSIERQAVPNQTLKGFNYIDQIKEVLENKCPGVVSCADILALATRDGIVLSGGPYYPILTGRRDSNRSYFSEALDEIPRPDSSISETLHLFSQRGFNERETVTLLGGHNIGSISCEFILPRLPMIGNSVPFDFLQDMRRKCQDVNGSMSSMHASQKARHLAEALLGMQYYQGLTSAHSHGGGFDSHYYQALKMGKGLLTADQELMANEKTAETVLEYADDTKLFRAEFAAAMIKLSSLNVLEGSEGEVRRNCSILNSSEDVSVNLSVQIFG